MAPSSFRSLSSRIEITGIVKPTRIRGSRRAFFREKHRRRVVTDSFFPGSRSSLNRNNHLHPAVHRLARRYTFSILFAPACRIRFYGAFHAPDDHSLSLYGTICRRETARAGEENGKRVRVLFSGRGGTARSSSLLVISFPETFAIHSTC